MWFVLSSSRTCLDTKRSWILMLGPMLDSPARGLHTVEASLWQSPTPLPSEVASPSSSMPSTSFLPLSSLSSASSLSSLSSLSLSPSSRSMPSLPSSSSLLPSPFSPLASSASSHSSSSSSRTKNIPERVMASKLTGSIPLYLVKMVGSRATAAKWMSIDEFEDPQIILDYRLAVGLDHEEPVEAAPVPVDGHRPSRVPDSALQGEAKRGDEPKEGKEGKERKEDDDGGKSGGEGELPEQEDDDDSWRRPSCAIAASMAKTTTIAPYVYDADSKEAPEWLSIVPAPGAGGGSRISDLLAATHAELLISAYITYRSQPMIIPMSSFFRTSGTVRLPRLTSMRSHALAHANARYLLGCLLSMGYPRATLSLEMFGHESVARHLIHCLELRRLGAQRRYQLCLELRTITWHISTRGPTRMGLDRVESAPLVEGMLAELSKEKRAVAKKRSHLDEDDMVESGQWLSREDQNRLSLALRSYFSAAVLNPTEPPSVDAAWRYQGMFVLHLLCDDVIAVPRTELLTQLQLGSTFSWHKQPGSSQSGQWMLKMDGGKTKQPTLLRLPASSNPIVRAWLKFYRTVLLRGATHSNIFVCKNGSAPRLAFSAQCRSLQLELIGKSSSMHAFRGMQATASAHMPPEQYRALAWSRQHSEATSKKYYTKPSKRHLAEISEEALSQLRAAKRPKTALALDGDQYTEVVQEEVDEE